jgi:hypothetical protein
MLGRRIFPAFLIPLALSRFTPSCVDLSEPGAASLSDVEFSRLIHQVSEDGGYFWSNNYISNETSYLHVLDDLEKLEVKAGSISESAEPELHLHRAFAPSWRSSSTSEAEPSRAPALQGPDKIGKSRGLPL